MQGVKAKSEADRKKAALARSARWRRANPEYHRVVVRDSRYGLKDGQWDGMFEQQGRRCAICGDTDPHSKHGWNTDHDHTTGTVRGILCAPCNKALHERITPAILRAMADYLERSYV